MKRGLSSHPIQFDLNNNKIDMLITFGRFDPGAGTRLALLGGSDRFGFKPPGKENDHGHE
jgi:hypothetical protein